MELWIRTQNREALIKTNIIKWENGCLRGATDEDGWYQDLGKYKKKRALEVLDEIQEILIDYKEMSRVVYQMPQD